MTSLLTLGSLFDGIGGFPLAGVRQGFTPVWASEIEPFPIEVTKIRFPDMLHVGDITQLKGAELTPVDAVCGGSPCQDLSVAGKRAGLQGERSGLFMEQVRVIKEMRAHDKASGRTADTVRPRYMVWENVPGAFSSADGEDFRAVLEETCRIADSTVSVPRPPGGIWQSAGVILGEEFSLAWRIYDAQYWSVPQRRKRIFLVADFGGRTAPQILFEQDRLFGDSAESQETREGATICPEAGAGNPGGHPACPVAFACNQRDEVRDLNDVAGAIQAQPGMKQQTFIAETTGHNGSHCLTPWDTQQDRIFTENSISPTLAGADGGGGRNPGGLLFTAAFSAGQGSKAGGIGYQAECAPTLKASESGTNMVPSVLCLNDQGGNRMDITEDITATLRAQMDGHPPLEKQEYVLKEPASKENRYILFGGRILNMEEQLEKRLLRNLRAHKVRGGICSDITGCKSDMFNCLNCEFFVPDGEQLAYYEEQAALWREKCIRFSSFPVIKGNAERNAESYERILAKLKEGRDLL